MLKVDVIIQQKLCSRSVEIPGGRGVIKDPLGTEIPKGWGVLTEKPSLGGVWIFSGTTHYFSFTPLRLIVAILVHMSRGRGLDTTI